MNNSNRIPRARGTRWCQIGTWLALAGIVLIIVSLAGSRFELLQPITSFLFFGFAFLIFILTVLVTTVGIVISMGTAGEASALYSWSALTISIIIISTTMSQRPDTSGAPPIHDLTTDISNPPAFIAILPLRAEAPNPPEYAGADTAEQQQAAYPDLMTLTIDKPVDEVLTEAEQVVRVLGWDIVAIDQAMGHIEATDTSTWFRFKDDVVIRLTPNNPGTRVDVRSKSRVGMGDMGANAERIRAFLYLLKTRTAD
ncbi:MAG: DUF1499 domain-containing protein [Gammaproteobacteria bacterium]|jgi:uncharacterized protein (DUF1499 family)|nr:DUF1499 domain-containing protein [Gammaproteobacteria bacterium]